MRLLLLLLCSLRQLLDLFFVSFGQRYGVEPEGLRREDAERLMKTHSDTSSLPHFPPKKKDKRNSKKQHVSL